MCPLYGKAKVGFGSPSGPVLNTLSLFPAKIFVTGKGKVVIQGLNYNLCFVDPSFRFVSIVLPSSVSFTSWIHSPSVLAWFVVLVLENRRIECNVARGFHNIQLKRSDILLRAIL